MVVFSLAQSPARGAPWILDRNAFGGGYVVVWLLFTVPFVFVWGVLSDGGREDEGEGTGAGTDSTVQVAEVDQLIIDRVS